jgi:hypothetical protein
MAIDGRQSLRCRCTCAIWQSQRMGLQPQRFWRTRRGRTRHCLAAQTIENPFGGISVIGDHARFW